MPEKIITQERLKNEHRPVLFVGDIKKCSDKSMEVKLPELLGNHNRTTDRSTDRPGYWEV